MCWKTSLTSHISLSPAALMGEPLNYTTLIALNAPQLMLSSCVMLWDTRPPPVKTQGASSQKTAPTSTPTFATLDLTWKPFYKVQARRHV